MLYRSIVLVNSANKNGKSSFLYNVFKTNRLGVRWMNQSEMLNSSICALLALIENKAKEGNSDSIDKTLPELVNATAELIKSQY